MEKSNVSEILGDNGPMRVTESAQQKREWRRRNSLHILEKLLEDLINANESKNDKKALNVLVSIAEVVPSKLVFDKTCPFQADTSGVGICLKNFFL